MDQIYIDTLKAVMVYKYELDAAILELERVSHNNTILCCVIVALVMAAVTAAYYIVQRHNRKLNAEKFANRLLSRQAENLPVFANEVNKISGKSIKLSGILYDELQDAITRMKNSSKSGIVEVVNDAEFVKMYPFIKELDFLSPQEKLVLILTEENYSLPDIALYTGTTEASVRAIKSRIRGKLMQSGSIGERNQKLKIFKKNQL
ncbi:MAG: hypothetical protein J6Q34_01935 [Bacteroidales bacterium]|nr:hypothetical protein [Bacteroidales bacterium]